MNSVQLWLLTLAFVVISLAVWFIPIILLEAKAKDAMWARWRIYLVALLGFLSWPGFFLGVWLIRRNRRAEPENHAGRG